MTDRTLLTRASISVLAIAIAAAACAEDDENPPASTGGAPGAPGTSGSGTGTGTSTGTPAATGTGAPTASGTVTAPAAPPASPGDPAATPDNPSAPANPATPTDPAPAPPTNPAPPANPAPPGTVSPKIGDCPMLPPNHIFNTPIDGLPQSLHNTDYMGKLGAAKIHLDLGQQTNQQADDYYGIPYNVVTTATAGWTNVAYTTKNPDYGWDPKPESDCAAPTSHGVVTPCTTVKEATPQFPIPSGVQVEAGIFPDVVGQDDYDHHILVVDTTTCRLWEAYHAFTGNGSTWDIFGSATWDLNSNALRPDTWTSADAAGFPILPLLLRADEASSGEIKHALRFTIPTSQGAHVWPARHDNDGTTDTKAPPMGQLFRIKASYTIPSGFSTQSKAILGALKKYGMYLADGGTTLYIQGEPSASWSDAIFDEVQTVGADQFEAVDTGPIMSRAGFDPNSGAVPP